MSFPCPELWFEGDGQDEIFDRMGGDDSVLNWTFP